MGALTAWGNANRWPNAIFMSKVREQPDGCWKWVGALARGTHGAYGEMTTGGRKHRAHRLAWLLFRGPIPAGLHIDHLCRNTRCVNPDHLEPVTKRENNLRSFSPAALNARKTECVRGHAFDESNTVLRPNGSRACRECINWRARKNRALRNGATTRADALADLRAIRDAS